MDGAVGVAERAGVDTGFVDRLFAARVTEVESAAFARQPVEVIAFTLLAIQARLGEAKPAAGPNTPSGAVPPYEKPAAQAKTRGRKRGGRNGHPGSRRASPVTADRTRHQRLDHCPDCGTKLRPTGETRERISEDIPENLKPVVTKDILHRDYCPQCRKRVEPKPPDLLPRCTLGNRTLVFSGLLHFSQGLTISQIVDTFNFHLRLKITPGGLVQMWHRLGEVLRPWYEEIHEHCLEGAKLHADETGWRVAGETQWLWCFANDHTAYYMIDRSRGSPALQKFFTRYFDGTLITDFWSPYDAIACADQQKCWPHLLRDAASVDEKSSGDLEWSSFCRRLVGVYRDAKKLHVRRPSTCANAAGTACANPVGTACVHPAAAAQLSAEHYELSIHRLEARLIQLGTESWTHPDAQRLSKRLLKYSEQLLTFLRYDNVTSDNNPGERAIRPAVMIRKTSYANQSQQGATTQSILMTIFRTLRLRGQQPIDTLLAALATYNQAARLPPFPETPSDG